MMNKNVSKILALIVLVAVIAGGVIYFDLTSYMNLETLKSKQRELSQYIEDNLLMSSVYYFAAYTIATAVSIPGALILTLAGGALFGLLHGLILVSFASTCGATLAFLASRFFLKEMIQSKFSSSLKSVNEGIQKEGGFYLFTLRLVPLFPFFLINLVMGLTPMKAFTFFWISQLGMLPGTFVYVNAGTQISKIDSLQGILSPTLWLSFALLGIFPIVAKKIIDWVKARRQKSS